MPKYCTQCDRNVTPKKRFNWSIFLLLCLTLVGGIFYVIWFILRPNNRCPICNGTDFEAPRRAGTSAK